MTHIRSNFPLPFARLSLLLAATAFVGGCGGDGKTEVTDDIRFTGLISSVQSAAGTSDSFAALFADGAAPDEETREKFVQHEYSVKSSQVTGESATLTIAVDDLKTLSEVGQVQWTLVKQGDSWLLKDAPLP